MKNLLIILFLFPLFSQAQQPVKIKGFRLVQRTAHPDDYLPGGSGGATPTNYEIIEANANAVDTAIDGIGCIVQGDTATILGGWNASNGLPYTRRSLYGLRLLDYSRQYKVYASWTPRHSFGYGTGGTGIGYVFGGDWQPESTPASRREVWKTTSNTSARNWTLVTNTPGWNDSICLFGYAIQPDSISGVDTIWYAGGQKNYDITKGVSSKIYRSVDAGSTWSQFADMPRFFGGSQNGCFAWFGAVRKFVILKGAKYDNDVGTRTWADSVFFLDENLSTPQFLGRLNPTLQYPAMCVWDNKMWIVCGNYTGGNTTKIYTISTTGVFSEMVVNTPTALHATSVAVDQVNDRLIIACGNLVKNVWYIRHVAL
jgi:hypothetical protein